MNFPDSLSISIRPSDPPNYIQYLYKGNASKRFCWSNNTGMSIEEFYF